MTAQDPVTGALVWKCRGMGPQTKASSSRASASFGSRAQLFIHAHAALRCIGE